MPLCLRQHIISMQQFTHIHLETVDSTNNFLRSYQPEEKSHITLVTADYQTAGRGQRGNSWESEEGKNVVYSLLIHPSTVRPSQIFSISEIAALSVCQALNEFLPEDKLRTSRGGFRVKWPNDIYYEDCKIAGILIETDLMGGHIANAIIGVGININQQQFLSDAPNPISLYQIKGELTNRKQLLATVMDHFKKLYEQLEQGEFEAIHYLFMQHLYRNEGMHPYTDEGGAFMARIVDVEPSGHLILEDMQGSTRRYAFKEVSFVIPQFKQ